MVNEKIYITNQLGLHMRPSIALSKTALGLRSNIKIIFGEKIIDPKNILVLLGAGITKGSEITIICVGETEEEDLQVMLEAISDELGD